MYSLSILAGCSLFYCIKPLRHLIFAMANFNDKNVAVCLKK